MGFKDRVRNQLFILDLEMKDIKGNDQEIFKRLNALRDKLDLLMAHLNLAFDTEPAKPETQVIRSKKEVDKNREEEAERLKKAGYKVTSNMWPGHS